MLCFLLASCKTAVTLYDNYLNDLDFEYRFDELAEQIEEGEDGVLLQMQITKLRDEMANYTDEDERINEINKIYVSSMDKLLLAQRGDVAELANARDLYAQATHLWDAFKADNAGGQIEEF